jgi:hypothetical protein
MSVKHDPAAGNTRRPAVNAHAKGPFMSAPSGRACRILVVGCMVLLLAWGSLAVLGCKRASKESEAIVYKPRNTELETSGVMGVLFSIEQWRPDAFLEEYAIAYDQAIPRGLAYMDQMLQTGGMPVEKALLTKVGLYNAQGEPAKALEVLEDFEQRIRGTGMEGDWLYTIVYYKGVTGLRMGENDNCVHCRGESACIFPISSAAVHTNPKGSRLAVKHFSEYLEQFPDDLEVKWLLNLAHMTLGEHPAGMDPRHRLSFDSFKSEIDIGVFRDISHRVGLTRINQSGGAIMDDFDNDGLLDIVITSWAPNESMAYYRNKGDGTFEDRTKAAGLSGQKGGLNCMQTDYNNDGHLDVFIPRGSWLPAHLAQRPSLLRNNGDGTFTDVTKEAGLLKPTNSTSATWADYDNDGFLDLFVCCHEQPCLLYRNRGDGTFEEVTARAGLPAADLHKALGAAWIDYDNDGYPDLFLNMRFGAARLFHNNRDGTFTEVTKKMGITGPINGFSCWAFDFDNDGWLDIFATSYSHTLGDVVKGLMNQPHEQDTAKLFRNLKGKGFQDVTKEMGLDRVYTPMGSNFGDLTNDGYLDFYLGTGDPNLSMLVPNRMFKNLAGRRFTEITASARTGHLQKGHGTAIGDWRRCGSVDVFMELGGAVAGDSYHNVLFQNPGHGNNWLNVKLIGKKTNRAAIGARIEVVTAGEKPLTVHRHVSSGSSFGANPLEQHVGLGKATKVASLKVFWPTSQTTQVFRDIDVNQGVVITEFEKDYRKRTWKPIAVPED